MINKEFILEMDNHFRKRSISKLFPSFETLKDKKCECIINKKVVSIRNIEDLADSLSYEDLVQMSRSEVEKTTDENLLRGIESILSILSYEDGVYIDGNASFENYLLQDMNDFNDVGLYSFEDENQNQQQVQEESNIVAENSNESAGDAPGEKAKFHVSIIEFGVKTKEVLSKVYMNLDKVEKQFLSFLQKLNVPRNMFYNNYYSRLPGLYSQFGGEATIWENDVHGDPVKIVLYEVPKYISNIINTTVNTYEQIMALNKSLISMDNWKTICDHIVANFITNDLVRDEFNNKLMKAKPNPDILVKILKKEARYRIGSAIIAGKEIYGYSLDGMVNKKYPPLKIALNSRIVVNPNTKPKEVSVSSIFDSGESLSLMGRELPKIMTYELKLMKDTIAKAQPGKWCEEQIKVIQAYKQQNKATKKMLSSAENAEFGTKQQMQFQKKLLSVANEYSNVLGWVVQIFWEIYTLNIRIDNQCQQAIKEMVRKASVDADSQTGSIIFDKDRKSGYTMHGPFNNKSQMARIEKNQQKVAEHNAANKEKTVVGGRIKQDGPNGMKWKM